MPNRRILVGAVAAGVLALPASALAAHRSAGLKPPPVTTTITSTTPAPTTPTSTTPTATTPTTPAPAPAATGRAELLIGGLTRVGSTDATVPQRAVTVTGVVSPYRTGQHVLVQGIEGGRVILSKRVLLRPSSRQQSGRFSVAMTAPRAGVVAVRLKHSASSTLSAFGIERHYTVLSEAVHLGSRGPFVTLLQSRLAGQHLYIPRTGVFDTGTQLALDAYNRLLGAGEGHTTVTPATVNDLLDGRGTFHVRFPHQGMHAEGDLSDQVLAYVDNDTVRYLLPISSGKPSTPTVLGSWPVYRKQPGYLPDGMYFTNFFTGGYAIHGYDPAPDFPASHGCMRIPIVDATFAYNLLSIGDWVDTYYT